MEYKKSKKYDIPELNEKWMGPNPLKLQEEMLQDHKIAPGSRVCDLGSGNGLTSVMLAKDYGFKVYAADLWSEPQDNQNFFKEMGLTNEQIVAVKADAADLPFEKEFFDAVVSTDSYNYWGRDPQYLDERLLPFVRPGGYVYACVPGMKKDCHDDLPAELLLSWTPEELSYLRDIHYWTEILNRCKGAEIITIFEMEGNEDLWAEWLEQKNYVTDICRRSIDAGGCRYINFIAFAMRKK